MIAFHGLTQRITGIGRLNFPADRLMAHLRLDPINIYQTKVPKPANRAKGCMISNIVDMFNSPQSICDNSSNFILHDHRVKSIFEPPRRARRARRFFYLGFILRVLRGLRGKSIFFTTTKGLGISYPQMNADERRWFWGLGAGYWVLTEMIVLSAP